MPAPGTPLNAAAAYESNSGHAPTVPGLTVSRGDVLVTWQAADVTATRFEITAVPTRSLHTTTDLYPPTVKAGLSFRDSNGG